MGEYENKPEGFPDRDPDLEREIITEWARQLVSKERVSFRQLIPFFAGGERSDADLDGLIEKLKGLFPAGERVTGRDGKGYVSTGGVTVHLERQDVYVHVADQDNKVAAMSVREISNDQLPTELRTHPIEEYQKMRKGKKK